MDTYNVSKFIAEDKQIDLESATKLAIFLEKTKYLKAVKNPIIYCNHGVSRVYFELWSQNNLPAMDGLRKSYYDAKKNTVVIVRYVCHWIYEDINDIKFHCIGLFSGSKTRYSIKELRDSL